MYASPKRGAEAVTEFYSHAPHSSGTALKLTDDEWEARVAPRMRHLVSAVPRQLPADARFLEIGFGDGACLEAARRLGYAVTGLELDERLVAQTRSRVPSADIQHCDLAEAGLASESFDFVYTWHTIEHVLDVRSWLAEVHRVLRPGGRVLIGTESAEAIQGRIWCAAFRVLGRTPWPPTSTDHTYWFTAATLGALLSESGFRLVRSSVYENPPQEALGTLRSANARGRLTQSLHVFAALLSTMRPAWGGKMLVVASRE